MGTIPYELPHAWDMTAWWSAVQKDPLEHGASKLTLGRCLQLFPPLLELGLAPDLVLEEPRHRVFLVTERPRVASTWGLYISVHANVALCPRVCVRATTSDIYLGHLLWSLCMLASVSIFRSFDIAPLADIVHLSILFLSCVAEWARHSYCYMINKWRINGYFGRYR